jgi:hypothetical protein
MKRRQVVGQLKIRGTDKSSAKECTGWLSTSVAGPQVSLPVTAEAVPPGFEVGNLRDRGKPLWYCISRPHGGKHGDGLVGSKAPPSICSKVRLNE